MNLYLIGYRGTGKTTVAPLVARQLGAPWNWVDLDTELERRAGRSIAAIFETDGEASFRDLEESVLADIAQRDRLVVATGGGVIGREANRRRLAQGFVVWLTASVATIARRVATDGGSARRPNLTAAGGPGEIEELLARREPVYRSLAQVTLATDERPASKLARAIANAFALAQTEAGDGPPPPPAPRSP